MVPRVHPLQGGKIKEGVSVDMRKCGVTRGKAEFQDSQKVSVVKNGPRTGVLVHVRRSCLVQCQLVSGTWERYIQYRSQLGFKLGWIWARSQRTKAFVPQFRVSDCGKCFPIDIPPRGIFNKWSTKKWVRGTISIMYDVFSRMDIIKSKIKENAEFNLTRLGQNNSRPSISHLALRF